VAFYSGRQRMITAEGTTSSFGCGDGRVSRTTVIIHDLGVHLVQDTGRLTTQSDTGTRTAGVGRPTGRPIPSSAVRIPGNVPHRRRVWRTPFSDEGGCRRIRQVDGGLSRERAMTESADRSRLPTPRGSRVRYPDWVVICRPSLDQ